jgi:hypothetical protein
VRRAQLEGVREPDRAPEMGGVGVAAEDVHEAAPRQLEHEGGASGVDEGGGGRLDERSGVDEACQPQLQVGRRVASGWAITLL